MYNYKVSEDVTDKVLKMSKTKSNTKVDDLIGKINKVNEKFATVDIPEYQTPKFEKMENIDVSSEDISKQAENALYDYKKSSIDKINDNYNTSKTALERDKESLIKNTSSAKDEIKDYYASVKENASNDALKRGFARSSIVINKLDAFNKDEIDTFNKLEKEYSDSLNAIDFEINSLTQQKKQALEDFDIAYAVKLSDEIAKLNSDLAEKQAAIIKYNNEIVEKEKKYQDAYNEFVKDIQDDNFNKDKSILELQQKYGSNVINSYKNNQINSILDDYFKNMSNNEIVDILLASEELKTVLGNKYEELLNKYK